MNSMQILASSIFVLGYAGIAMEHKIHVSKSATALTIGAVLWILAAVSGITDLETQISHSASGVFGILIFLLCAMSLVEILLHYKFFDIVRGWLFSFGLSERNQFVIMTAISFFLSAILDNLTTTIVMIQISRKFFKEKNLLYAAAGIVIAANAGGAWSPIGDVTTIMLWFAKKFSAIEIITKGLLPSLVLWLISTALIRRTIIPSDFDDETTEIITKLEPSEKRVIILTFASFLLPVTMSFIHLPPYMGLILGLGIVWVYVDRLKKAAKTTQTHLEASIDTLIQKTDIASLKFFVGILFAVDALHVMGILERLAHVVYGTVPTTKSLVVGNTGMGLLSAILDNVPLTAITIQMLHVTETSIWVLMALAVGTGGSLLVIGSAAGVVAMGMVKELNFGTYFRIAFIPALTGYIACIAMWCIQYYVFGF